MAKNHSYKTIAITGAGSGFGAALARHYSTAGWSVAVTDVDLASAQSVLTEIQGGSGNHFALHLDVTEPEHWQKLQDEIQSRWAGLGILVNNAGVAAAGTIEETSIEDWDWVLDIDLMGVVRGCHQFAGMMKRQKCGHIVNVSSAAGFAAIPLAAAYGVAKAGVIALSEALRVEMQPHGVGVTVVCPAFVKTGLLETFRSPHPDTRARINQMMERSAIRSEDVAIEIARAVDADKFLLLTHKQTRWALRLKRWFPERYFRLLTKHTIDL